MPDNSVNIRLGITGVAQVTNSLRLVAAGFTRLQATLGALGAVASVGGFAAVTKHAIDMADHMGKLAQKTGIAVEALSELTYAAQLGDLSTEALQNGLKKLQQEMAKAGEGGVDVQAKLLQIADEFSKTADGAAKSARAIELFGKSGLDLIPFLNQGSEAIRKQGQEAKTFGLVIGPQFAENADTFNDNLTRIKAIFEGLALQLADRLLPTLIQLQEAFIEFASDVAAREAIIAGLVELLKQTSQFAAGLAQAFEQAAIAVQGFKALLSASAGEEEAAFKSMINQSKESFDRFTKLIDVLERIGDEHEAAAESVKKHAAALQVLATRMETLKSLAAVDENARKRAQLDPGLSRSARDDASLAALKRQQDKLREMEGLVSLSQAGTASGRDAAGNLLLTQEQIAANKELLDIWSKQAEVQRQIADIMESSTFSGAMMKNLRQLSDEWRNLGVNIADTLTNGIKTAVDGVADAITGAIFKTRSWGETFRLIGQQIIASLIKVVLQWIVQQTIIKGIQAAYNAWTAAQNAASATAAAPAAALQSVASYGGAAAAGGAALAAVMSLALGFAGFMKGGFTGFGSSDEVAGMVHRGEFVVPAAATSRIGVSNLENMVSSAGGGGAVSVGGPTINNVTIPDFAAMREFLKSKMGTDEIVNVINSNRMRLGLA